MLKKLWYKILNFLISNDDCSHVRDGCVREMRYEL